jgi:uncharacterized SAM-binding protein YcdF (DUF218 family)
MSDTSNGVDYALYRYTPSIPAAIVFGGVFMGLSILHLIRLLKHRSYFFIPFLVGLLRKKPPSATSPVWTDR